MKESGEIDESLPAPDQSSLLKILNENQNLKKKRNPRAEQSGEDKSKR